MSREALRSRQATARLRGLGVNVPAHTFEEPDRDLYLLLEREAPEEAYSTYNALRRRLVSFCENADHVLHRRALRAEGAALAADACDRAEIGELDALMDELTPDWRTDWV